MRRGLVLEPPAGPAAVVNGTEFRLVNPHPISETLPGVWRESWVDEQRRTAREAFGVRFLASLDAVLAPILATLDNYDAYLDPDTTPEDFLAWMAQWVAATIDASWPEDRRRAFVGRAAELYRRRGTAAGLRDHIQIVTDGLVEVVENGASSWSPTADGKLPGSPEPVVVIRVTVDDPESIDRAKLEALIRTSKPAHVVHRLEIMGTAQRASRKAKAAAVPEPGADATSDDGNVQVPGATSEPDASAGKPAKPPAKAAAASTGGADAAAAEAGDEPAEAPAPGPDESAPSEPAAAKPSPRKAAAAKADEAPGAASDTEPEAPEADPAADDESAS